ncbi:MAG: 3-dehydroquinate synthase, partial [Corynebacterium matruchotii]
GIGVRAIRMTARIAPTNAAAPTTANTFLSSVGLPTSYKPGEFDRLYRGMTRDKKNRDGKIRFVALTKVGECTRITDATKAELEAAYQRISGK